MINFVKHIITKMAALGGKIVHKLLKYDQLFKIYNYLFEHSPISVVRILVRFIALPNLDKEWVIYLLNRKKITTKIYKDNLKTQQFALSYQWHSPALNFTELMIENYYGIEVPWIDVGANLGIRSLLALSQNRPVFFIEPNPELNNLNRERCKMNNFTNVTFMEVGASNLSGELEFYIDESSYNSSLNKEILGEIGIFKKEIIHVSPLDTLFQNKMQQYKTACIKIDVEGHELEVLAGADKIISKWLPTMIIEVNKESNNFEKFKEKIYQWDYSIYEIYQAPTPNKYFRKLEKDTTLNNIKSNDFLVVHDEQFIQFLKKYTY